eukprot:gb/GEZN01001114.1/.p1 GENE.gb/GEZN01001114.1/~~gb/GEZN01001114.1/.p1  ORF type:complete len:1078 (+),score=202.01 gb/GEZN01001114.1/:38-3271(+)
MVKSYLKYELRDSWGVLVSPEGQVQVDSTGKFAVSPALEHLAVWSIKEGVLVGLLGDPENKAVVTCTASTSDSKLVAAGYSDGRIRVWDVAARSNLSTLHGHSAAVTVLRFNSSGSLLASGSADTDVIVWDPVAERGLYRLRGHKDGVTDVVFLAQEGDRRAYLVTSSKDTLVKFWDLESQYCFQTVLEHRSQVWSLEINRQGTRLYTGSDDHLIRVFRLGRSDDVKGNGDARADAASANTDIAQFYGHLPRTSRRRVIRIRFDPTYSMLACQAADKVLDLYCVRSLAEATRKSKRRAKRVREKSSKTGVSAPGDLSSAAAIAPEGVATITGSLDPSVAGGGVASTSSVELEPSDEMQHMAPILTKAKVSSFCWRPNAKQRRLLQRAMDNKQQLSIHQLAAAGAHEIVFGLSDNSLTAVTLNKTDEGKALSHDNTASLHMPGHRSGVRTCVFSWDDQMLLSCSKTQLKIWSSKDWRCVRSLETGFGLCALFAPGNRHVIIGTKEGNLELWDLGGATLLEKVVAHQGKPVWCMSSLSDKSGFVTGGGDKELKFWEYQLSERETGQVSGQSKATVLSIVLCRTLKLTDEVLSIQCSPNGKLVAVGLLDSTVKVFMVDSLKFFLSLYGHRLPALCLDISSDSTLLISGSADKNIKIWGLDFGDCHKSLFAHTDSVMNVKFVPDTHYFFSVSKDKLLKYWDADKFLHISSHAAHHAEVWALALSKEGTVVVTGSNDRSLRKWEQTEEPLFLDEEREREMEEMFEDKAVTAQQQIGDRQGSGMEAPPESAAVARQQGDKYSLMSGEKLLEAIDLSRGERKRWKSYQEAVDKIIAKQKEAAAERRKRSNKKRKTGAEGEKEEEEEEVVPEVPQANFLLRGLSPEKYLLNQLMAVPSGHLEEALLVLPFEYAVTLLTYLDTFIQKEWQVELCVRALMVLLATHQNQLVSNKLISQTLLSLRKCTLDKIELLRDRIGFNMAGLSFLDSELKANQNAWSFGPASEALVSAASKRSNGNPTQPARKGSKASGQAFEGTKKEKVVGARDRTDMRGKYARKKDKEKEGDGDDSIEQTKKKRNKYASFME